MHNISGYVVDGGCYDVGRRREADKRGWLQQAGSELVFRFDGDVVQEHDTAAGLDMEEDDVIDVTFT